MPKLPSFPFYPGDWLRNDVAGCPLEAQGLWLRMMIVMHDAETYGELSINGQPMPDEFIAKKCGISRRIYRKNLEILESFRIVSRKENGVIYSGRMVRDERKRQQNAERQRNHYDRHKGDEKGEPNAEPHAPSSSSSSSSGKSKEEGKEKRWETVAEAAPKRKKGTRLPDQFFLTPEMREYAAAKNPGVDVAIETEKFCNYFRAAPGQKGVKMDWILTWKNWILNARGNGHGTNRQNQNGNGRKSTLERIADHADIIAQYPTEAELRGQS